MLIISLGLHLSLVAGVALSYFRGSVVPGVVSSEMATAPTMLLRSEVSPFKGSNKVASAKSAVPPIAVTSSVATPALAPSPTLKPSPAVTQPAALALESNPNAHVRSLPPESVLSPNPAPHLNNADGVVFLLDISGSMYEPYAGSTRLAFAREALSRQIRALKDGTPFAIALYAQRACTSGPLVAASGATREAAVRFIMRDVDCGGGTNLPAGFAAAEQLHPGALVLASDGDLNISAFNLAMKAREILGPQEHCPLLSIIGIAPRVEKGEDRLLQGLADVQGGSYQQEQFGSDSELVTSASNVIKPATATP
jgi:von Willebrand factor type A domain